MEFDYLDLLDETSFEAERCKLIKAEIEKSPPEHRKKLLVLQYRLDLIRVKSSPIEFMQRCMGLITEDLENMSDEFSMIAHLLGAKP